MQKIISFTFKIYEMIIARFSIQDKMGKIRFFEKSFLLTNTSIKVVIHIYLS